MIQNENRSFKMVLKIFTFWLYLQNHYHKSKTFFHFFIIDCIEFHKLTICPFQTNQTYFSKKTFTFLQLKHVNRKLECHLNWWMLSSILWKDLIIWEAITLERKCDHTVYCCSEIPYSFAPKLWDLLPNSNKILPYLS